MTRSTYEVVVSRSGASARAFASLDRRDAVEHFRARLSEHVRQGWRVAREIERSTWAGAKSGVLLAHPADPQETLEIALSESY